MRVEVGAERTMALMCVFGLLYDRFGAESYCWNWLDVSLSLPVYVCVCVFMRLYHIKYPNISGDFRLKARYPHGKVLDYGDVYAGQTLLDDSPSEGGPRRIFWGWVVGDKVGRSTA